MTFIPTSTTAEPAYWSAGRKIALRFFLLFFVLYVILNGNGVLPYSEVAYGFYIRPFQKLIVWLTANVLHLNNPVTTFTSGSGDTTYDYLAMLFDVVLSVIGAFVWTLADRKARNYNNLFYWLTVVIRY
jgi:hypothetical protein